MISYYFGSKEKLMEAVFEERTAHIRLRVEALLQKDELSPIQKINLLIDGYIDRVFEQPEFHRIMVREQMVENNSVIAGIIQEGKIKNLEMVKKLIKDGQKKKAFKKDIDIVLMVNTMTGTVMQVLSTQAHYRQIHKLEHLSEAEFHKHLKKILASHLKMLFKAILTYEA
jgi:AcrR family transcriptional regulator